MKNIWSPAMIKAEKLELLRRSFTDTELKEIALDNVRELSRLYNTSNGKLSEHILVEDSRLEEMNRESRKRYGSFYSKLFDIWLQNREEPVSDTITIEDF